MRSYRTFSPLPAGWVLTDPAPAGGLFSVALSLGSPPPGVTRHRVSVEPGLSSPRPTIRTKGSYPAVWPEPNVDLGPAPSSTVAQSGDGIDPSTGLGIERPIETRRTKPALKRRDGRGEVDRLVPDLGEKFLRRLRRQHDG